MASAYGGRRAVVGLALVLMAGGMAFGAGEPGKGADAEVEVAEGVTAKEAQAWNEKFKELMREKKFDVIDSYAGGNAYMFTVRIPSMEMSAVVMRDGERYRMFVIRDDKVRMVASEGKVVGVGEEGGKGVLQVCREMGVSAVVEYSENGLTLKAGPDAKAGNKGVFRLGFSDLLKEHALKYNLLYFKQKGQVLNVMSKGPRNTMVVNYDLGMDAVRDFSMLTPDGKVVLAVDQFMRLPTGTVRSGMKIPAGGKTADEDVMVVERSGPGTEKALDESVGRLRTSRDKTLEEKAGYALNVLYLLELRDLATLRSVILVRDRMANALLSDGLKPAELDRLFRAVVRPLRMVRLNGSEGKYLNRVGAVLGQKVVGENAGLVLQRQLLLADGFLSSEEAGIPAESLTGLDGLVSRYLEGAPGWIAPAKGTGFAEKEGMPSWAVLMGRMKSGAFKGMEPKERRGLVEGALLELEVYSGDYLSTARVLSNLLKDAEVRKGVEEAINARLEKEDARGADKLLRVILREDADAANRAWLAEVTKSTLAGLKPYSLTQESLKLMVEINNAQGMGATTTALARSFCLRPDRQEILGLDENGKPDFVTFIKAMVGTGYETIITQIKGKTPHAVSLLTLAVAFNADIPWKWRRELGRRLGGVLAEEPDEATQSGAALMCLKAFRYAPMGLRAGALEGVRTYCLSAKTPYWAMAFEVLLEETDCGELLKVTGAKDFNGALKVLDGDAFVKAHEGELRALAEKVKAPKGELWLEEKGREKKESERKEGEAVR